jgi:hypothetical protein
VNKLKPTTAGGHEVQKIGHGFGIAKHLVHIGTTKGLVSLGVVQTKIPIFV